MSCFLRQKAQYDVRKLKEGVILKVSLTIVQAIRIVTYRESLDLRIDFSRTKRMYGVNIAFDNKSEFIPLVSTAYEMKDVNEATTFILEVLETAVNMSRLECRKQGSVMHTTNKNGAPYSEAGFLNESDIKKIKNAFDEEMTEVFTADILQT